MSGRAIPMPVDLSTRDGMLLALERLCSACEELLDSIIANPHDPGVTDAFAAMADMNSTATLLANFLRREKMQPAPTPTPSKPALIDENRRHDMTPAQKLLIGERPIDRLREAPAEGWELHVFGAPLNFDGHIYPHNASVPLSILEGRNTSVLLRQGRLRWCPPSATASPKPTQVTPPAPAKPHHEVVLMGAGDLDAVSAWKRTLDHMAALYDGNYPAAADRIRAFTVVTNGSSSQPGLALYLRAQKQNHDQQVRNRWRTGGLAKPLYGDL